MPCLQNRDERHAIEKNGFTRLYNKRATNVTARLILALLLASSLSGCRTSDGIQPHATIPLRRPGVLRADSHPGRAVASRPATRLEQEPLALEQAIEIALANNPQLAAAGYEVDAASAEHDVALGAILPHVSVQGGYTLYREERLIQPRRPGTSEVLGFTDQLVSGDFVLTMPLFMGGRLLNRIKAAELMTNAVRHQWCYSRSELAFNVSSVFYSMRW